MKKNFTYLGETSREDADLEVLGHLLEEVFGAGAFHDIDVGDAALDIHRNRVVRAAHLVELTVNQRLIQIKYQGFHAMEALGLGAEESVRALTASKDDILLPSRHSIVVLGLQTTSS